jgi:hypothetical protein
MIERGPSGFRRLRTSSNIRAAIDSSSVPFKDRIYVTWVEFENNDYVVKVTHSDDLGLSWSNAVTVNDNNGPHDSANAAIAVNRDGIVSVVWNDRRDDVRGECYRLYVSASLDGGDTFLPNVQVNSHRTCPNTQGNWSGSASVFSDSNSIILSGVPNRFSNGGETQGLAAGPDGRFHVIWINGESGVMQLWYTSLTVQPGNQKVGVRRVDRTKEVPVEVSPPALGLDSNSPGAVRRVDRTKEVSLEVSGPALDFDSKSLGFTVRLKNQTATTISGTVTLVLGDVEADFAGMTVSNADNGLTGKGAEWRFVVNGELAPGAVSEPHSIRWHFDGQVPNPLTKLDAIVANFRVFTEGH